MSCLCDKCAALCCRYFALPIDNPRTAKDYDNIRWYLCHENVVAFIEKKQWYVGILNRCKHLQADNRCGIYETRPKICREYSTDNCDFYGGEYDFEVLFTSAEQLAEYGREKLALARERKGRKRRKVREKPAPAVVGRSKQEKRRGGNVVPLAGRAKRDPKRLARKLIEQGDTGLGVPVAENGNGRHVSLPLLRR